MRVNVASHEVHQFVVVLRVPYRCQLIGSCLLSERNGRTFARDVLRACCTMQQCAKSENFFSARFSISYRTEHQPSLQGFDLASDIMRLRRGRREWFFPSVPGKPRSRSFANPRTFASVLFAPELQGGSAVPAARASWVCPSFIRTAASAMAFKIIAAPVRPAAAGSPVIGTRKAGVTTVRGWW